MSKETKNKVKRHPDPTGVITGIILLLMGLAALYGWWNLEPPYFSISLYIIAIFFTSIGAFGIVYEFTAGGDGRVDRTNYAMVVMVLILAAILVCPSISTDITALRWLLIIPASLLGFIGLVTLAVQVNKDIRSRPRPTLGWITVSIIIAVLDVIAAYCLARPAILVLIPLALVSIYAEYLRYTFLGKEVKEAQGSEVIDKPTTDVVTPTPILGIKLPSRDALRNLVGIRSLLYPILMVFAFLFYIIATQIATGESHFSSLCEGVVYAYVGILAIVIAFAILVIQRGTQKDRVEPLKRALKGLAQMYVFFALIAVTGLLLGTDINGEVLTRSVEPSEILGSVDASLNICRIITIEFTILAFPTGLLYLYAMIKDFLKS